jgi:hypothetical protein
VARKLKGRMTAPRRLGLALLGVLGVVLAVASGTAFASAGSASGTGMAGMSSSWGGGHVGTTKGWYDGHTVTFRYTKNFFCKTPPASGASSKCEAGTDYTQTPSGTFDPLYVVVPLGFTPPKSTLQCPVAGHCIDHPKTIDLSAVLGSGTSNVLLPAHSHVVATANNQKAEWWNVDVVAVKNLAAWNKIVHAKSDRELRWLQKNDSKEVTGNITTNLFLYFAVKTGSWCHSLICLGVRS